MSKTSEFIQLSNEYRDQAEGFIQAVDRGRSIVLVAADLEANQSCSLVYGDSNLIFSSLMGVVEALSPEQRINLARLITDKARLELHTTDQTAN